MTIRRKGNSTVHRTTPHKIEILLTKYRRNCVEKENVNAECEGRLNIFINSIRFSRMQLNFGANEIFGERRRKREKCLSRCDDDDECVDFFYCSSDCFIGTYRCCLHRRYCSSYSLFLDVSCDTPRYIPCRISAERDETKIDCYFSGYWYLYPPHLKMFSRCYLLVSSARPLRLRTVTKMHDTSQH